jgi:hypothetical protein
MERFVFDGRLKAILVLDDIRTGDTIEYSYSLQATKEPLFGRLSGRFVVAMAGFAAKEVRCRLVYHPERPVYCQAAKPEWQPKTAYTPEGYLECEWVIPDVKPMLHVPGFRPPFRAIDYSEFATWEEVATAGSALFSDVLEPLPEHLANWVEQVRQDSPTPEEFLLQIIRYVQEKIRYVAVSIEDHTVKPYDILTILERHYGDCKDKSILLCRLLRAAGYDALPALVNAYRGTAATNGVAHPGAFDHAIARLKMGEDVHWIDATISHQGGRLGKIWRPHFGKALVLCSPGLALETVAPPPTIHSVSHDEFIKVNPHGGTAELRITRIFKDHAADDMRHTLSDAGAVSLEKRLLTAYREIYPEVTIQAPQNVTDDRAENKITFVHSFLLSGIWNQTRRVRHGQSLNQTYFPVFGIQKVLLVPKQGHRSHSFKLQHPIRIEASLDVRMPAGLQPRRAKTGIKSPGFISTFESQVSSTQGRVDIKYRSQKSTLKPEELEQHVKAVEQLANLAGIGFAMPELFVQRGQKPQRGLGRS